MIKINWRDLARMSGFTFTPITDVNEMINIAYFCVRYINNTVFTEKEHPRIGNWPKGKYATSDDMVDVAEELGLFDRDIRKDKRATLDRALRYLYNPLCVVNRCGHGKYYCIDTRYGQFINPRAQRKLTENKKSITFRPTREQKDIIRSKL